VRAVGVCLLHAYANPAHEQRVRELVLEEAPELVVVCSHEVAPEWREYERWSSTVVSAYVTPVIAGYLSRLAEQLETRGLARPLRVMQSNGGVTSASLVGSSMLISRAWRSSASSTPTAWSAPARAGDGGSSAASNRCCSRTSA
jgi:N-methylhydantoinase A